MRWPLWRRDQDRELREEVRAHMEMAVRDAIDRGESRGESRAQAEAAVRRQFGNELLVRETTREQWGWAWLEQLGQDLRYGARSLLKSPAFTLMAILTLALGVGANTAIFSLTSGVLLKPYGFRDLDQLVLLRQAVRNRAGRDTRITAADYLDLRSTLAASGAPFQAMAAFQFHEFNLARAGEVDDATGYSVSPNLFDMLGVQPRAGRGFLPEEAQPGRDAVVLLNDSYWKRRFGADPAVVGSTIMVDGHNATIVGIMPPGFNYPVAAEVWTPLALSPAQWAERGKATLFALARLAPGETLASAGDKVRAQAAELEQRFPASNDGRSFPLLLLRREQYEFTGPVVLLLQSAAFFVLLLACANLGTITLIRSISRQRELAIRTAVGATRFRLLRFFLAESAIFSLLAGAAALAASYWSVRLIRGSLNPSYTKWVAGWDTMRLDGNVLAAALATLLLVVLLLSLATVAHAGRIDLNHALKEGGRGGSGRGHNRLRGILVTVQIVLAMVLLVGAGLEIAGFQHLQDVFTAFDPAHILRFGVSLPESRYSPAQSADLYDQLLARTSALPGMGPVALITNNPASNVESPRTQFTIEGREAQRTADILTAERQTVSADIFSVLRIPILEGRALAASDGRDAPKVVVISRGMAQRFWPGSSPLGQRIKLAMPGGDAPWLRIVGVVGDMQLNWFEPQPGPVLYLPIAQAPVRTVTFLARTAATPATYAAAVQQHVSQLDALLSAREISPYTVEVGDSLAGVRLLGLLTLAFGVVALLLSAAGIYGVVGHAVAQSTHEFGVRMALGASRSDVLALVTGKALRLAALGVLLGSAAALALARVAQSFLFGVISLRPAVFAGFALLLLAVALAAALVPARRAATIDPMAALRNE